MKKDLPAASDGAVWKIAERDALAYAKHELARYASYGSSPWGHDPLLMPAASLAFMRQFLRRVALEHPLHRMTLIEWARAGEPVVHEVLVTLILEMKSRGETLPTELAAYDMEITRGSLAGRRTAPGKRKMSNLLRDICICVVVAGVCDRFRLKPTGSAKARRSACSVVAEALGDVGMRMSEAAVVKIWQRLRGGMPDVPGWASR